MGLASRTRNLGAVSFRRNTMAKSTDPKFYKSGKWVRERNLYRQQHPFCERCLMIGRYRPTEIVHHREYLDDNKAKDAEIALNFRNLEALCFECHNKEHHNGANRAKKKRFFFQDGELVFREPPLSS